jgi:hypothetical protein
MNIYKYEVADRDNQIEETRFIIGNSEEETEPYAVKSYDGDNFEVVSCENVGEFVEIDYNNIVSASDVRN